MEGLMVVNVAIHSYSYPAATLTDMFRQPITMQTGQLSQALTTDWKECRPS